MRRETKAAIGAGVLALLVLAGAFGLLAIVMLASFGCHEHGHESGSCPRAPQIDTTGHVIVCACVCESDRAAQCPMLPSDPTRSAVPACWDDASSSEGSSGG